MGNCSNACGYSTANEVVTNEVQVDPYASNTKHYNKNDSDRDINDIISKDKKMLKNLIKIQSAWRGYSARNYVQFIKDSKRQGESKYFNNEESKETLSRTKYDPNAKREDRPTYTFKTKATYTGQWIGGFRDGYGVQVWPDGARYEGDWRQHKAQGKGKFTHADGDVYEGNWVNDKANGYGIYLHVNGAKYEGQWKDDLQHGQGKESWTDGSVYEGHYVAGKKHGRGVYSWKDGSRYEGEWHENKINGVGLYEWLDGRKYMGQWIDNNMDGIGVYMWVDGRRYEGQYKDDKKDGYGVYQWQDGRQYNGMWNKGKQHGLGTYHVPNEQIKFGLWEDGKRIKWFDEQTVQAIEDGSHDYKVYFKTQESQIYTNYSKFSKPQYFDNQLQTIKNQFNVGQTF